MLYANNSIPTNDAITINNNNNIVKKLIASNVVAIAINISLNEFHALANLNTLNTLNVLNAVTAVIDPPDTLISAKSNTYSTNDIATIVASNIFI